MTSRQFIEFIEQKLAEHGVRKVVPGIEVIRSHARCLVEERLAERAISKIRTKIAAQAAEVDLPADLRDRVETMIQGRPELSWDQAVLLMIEAELA
jgi:hypothetical protein